MRFIGQRKSKKDDSTIYDFALGGNELRLMHDILKDAFLRLPKGVLEIQTTRHRLSGMVKEMWLQIRANNIKK